MRLVVDAKSHRKLMKRLLLILASLQMAGMSLHAQLPVLTNQPDSQAMRPGATVMFAVRVSGTGPFSCQWQCNGTNMPNGIITTVAGNGTPGYSGDGRPATSATLEHPTGVAVDAFENLFIAAVGCGPTPNVAASVLRETRLFAGWPPGGPHPVVLA
jgi:hypothetical protein